MSVIPLGIATTYCQPRIHHSSASNVCIYCPLFHSLGGPLTAACHQQQRSDFKLPEQSRNKDFSNSEGDHILCPFDHAGANLLRDAEVWSLLHKKSSSLYLPSPSLPPTVSNRLLHQTEISQQ